MRRAGVALILLLVGCGGSIEPASPIGQGATSTTTSAVPGSATTNSTLEAATSIAAPTTVQPPGESAPNAPETVESTLEALAAMPDEMAGAPRRDSGSGESRYVTEDGEFGIEATEVEDAFGSGTTLDEAISLVAADISNSEPCDSGNVWCLAGTTGASLVKVWGNRQSNIMLAAIAPDQVTLDELLAAWNAVTG